MKLGERTRPEVEALPRDIVVIIPFASCEQHSLHLPFLTDTMIMQEILDRLDQRVPDQVLILPVQWLGFSYHHSRYPGTLTARSTTHIEMMLDIVDSIVRGGFGKFLVLNSHGGNGAGISVLLQRLLEKYEELEVYSRGAWGSKLDPFRDAGPAGSGHSGETETSMILAMRPELVKTDLLDPDGDRDRPQGPGLAVYKRFDQRTKHGGVGDPRTASAEKGEKMLDASADELAELIPGIRSGEWWK